MTQVTLEQIVAAIPNLDPAELKALEMSVGVAIRMHEANRFSDDAPILSEASEEGPGLHDHALTFLSAIDSVELSLADQALLASLILSDGYEQQQFSSRDINDIIEENRRPRIAHVTSTITALLNRDYLDKQGKGLSLTKEGRAKARGLIGMLQRRVDEAA
ncbi:MAG: hypothetical protein AAF236_05805 [Verrucomicrobiota bacterium]